MGRFYGKLPSELVQLEVDSFRLDYIVWRLCVLEQQRQSDITQHMVDEAAGRG